jgi:Ca2+-binding EF-hand superfamily protein
MGQKINIVEDLLNHPDDEAKVKTVFKKYDTDNTGDLSKDEFTQFVKEGFFFFFLISQSTTSLLSEKMTMF